jgi:hypothetical protein
MRHQIATRAETGARGAHVAATADRGLRRDPRTGQVREGFSATFVVYDRDQSTCDREPLWTHTCWLPSEQDVHKRLQDIALLVRSVPSPWDRAGVMVLVADGAAREEGAQSCGT